MAQQSRAVELWQRVQYTVTPIWDLLPEPKRTNFLNAVCHPVCSATLQINLSIFFSFVDEFLRLATLAGLRCGALTLLFPCFQVRTYAGELGLSPGSGGALESHQQGHYGPTVIYHGASCHTTGPFAASHFLQR